MVCLLVMVHVSTRQKYPKVCSQLENPVKSMVVAVKLLQITMHDGTFALTSFFNMVFVMIT